MWPCVRDLTCAGADLVHELGLDCSRLDVDSILKLVPRFEQLVPPALGDRTKRLNAFAAAGLRRIVSAGAVSGLSRVVR